MEGLDLMGCYAILDEQKVREYIKNQQEQDSIAERYDTDLAEDPFKGASSRFQKEDKD